VTTKLEDFMRPCPCCEGRSVHADDCTFTGDCPDECDELDDSWITIQAVAAWAVELKLAAMP